MLGVSSCVAGDSIPPSRVAVGGTTITDLARPDGATQDNKGAPCTYTQPIAYVHNSVDATKPCDAGDGTCISGRMLIDTQMIQVRSGDIGEAYLFARPGGAPIVVFRLPTPPTTMRFKIPNIPAAALSACTTFRVGGRLDVGGNNQGQPGGSEDPVLPALKQPSIALTPGKQINNLEFIIPVRKTGG